MNTHKLLFIVLISIIYLSGCGKSGDSTPTGGKGGNANITLNFKHHGIAHNLVNGKVYIKYNTQDVPSNGVYDDSATATDADTMQTALFSGLKNGSYYFYGKGCDTSLFQHVVGGIPFIISSQANQTYDLPVSENGQPCP